ncbi:MAG: glycosyltransferase family 2 protein [Terriglobia bacterium]
MTNFPAVRQKLPAVSIIIPAFQTTEYIAQALDSVLGQTFRDFEIIVVNDGSPDTLELECVLQPYKKEIVYIKQPNGGLARARNVGILHSRAPIIALLDSDDYWAKDFLATQVHILEDNPAVDVVYPNALLVDYPKAAGRTYMDIYPSKGAVTFLSILNGECTVMGPGATIRRAIFERTGLYDPELRHAEDLDLWLRILKHNGRIIYHRRPVYHLRYRLDSLSRQSSKMHASILGILEKMEKMFSLSEEEKAAVENARQRISAAIHLERGKAAFFRGDVESAIREIASSNQYKRSWKLGLVLVLMKTAPGVLRSLAAIRSRESP